MHPPWEGGSQKEGGKVGTESTVLNTLPDPRLALRATAVALSTSHCQPFQNLPRHLGAGPPLRSLRPWRHQGNSPQTREPRPQRHKQP